jgi:hypothetical protein
MALPELKRLAVRLFAVQAFRKLQSDSFTSRVFASFCRIDERNAAAVESGGITLADWLHDQLETSRTFLAGESGRPLAEVSAANDALRSLSAAIERSTCLKCADHKKTNHICRGQDANRDARQVGNIGFCIAVLHQLFGYFRKSVSDVIQQWVLDGDLVPLAHLDVRLSTIWRGEPRTQGPEERWQVSGRTRFRDREVTPHRLSDVQLIFQPAFFDWPSLLVVSWVLMHELACHAFTGFGQGSSQRPECAQDCPFFEGWMDEVAYLLLSADLSFNLRATRRARSEFLTDYRDDILAMANLFRAQRYGDDTGVPVSVHAIQWRLGVQAARDTRDVFERSPLNGDAQDRRRWSLKALIRLSYRIQRHAPAKAEAKQITLLLATLAARGRKAGREDPYLKRLLLLLTDRIPDISLWINSLQCLRSDWDSLFT